MFVYLDDIIKRSGSIEKHLRIVFQRLRIHNLTVNRQKFTIVAKKLNTDALWDKNRSNQNNTAIGERAAPQNGKQLLSFVRRHESH